ncbi:sensor histidine kinase [Cesiribacter andamanensis]|uniref:histidine kinase n=1 Tax=Cesiribacter andamanensis AMV16 TaxID=1279009 RepID=M7N292_9BACT|nr:PAS domain-containing sensor histidine kinase [Cesiribacter andamanensis]EMR02773.1 Phytochrome-like protein cph1 [Cesiribacter andamanensis AMV16]
MELLERETLALEEAQQQKERLYNLFMQAPSLLCINRGRDFVYELANPSYLDVFMVDASIIGRAALDVFPDADPAIVQIYTNVFETGQRFVGKELSITGDWKRNNSPYTRYFNLIYEPLRELDGSVSGIVTFGYEVTEHVSARQELEQNALLMQEMNEELNQKYLELGRINNDLDNFIYTASHDLRSPLVNLEGLLLALNKHLAGSITPQATTVLQLAGVSIDKLKRTIKDLTEITKAQKGVDDVREAVSFKEILEDIKTDLPQEYASLGALIREDFQVDTILYSRAGLRTILYNLVSNAIKYRSADRPLAIRISTSRNGTYTLLRVEDNGLGIPEQQLPKLFSMFTRLHTHVEGTGIGLYTIKRVIENNGGRIEVSSQLDKGSAFTVYMV